MARFLLVWETPIATVILSMRTTPDAQPPAPLNPLSSEIAEPEYPATEELPFRDYLRIIYRRRWMILSLVVLGVAFAAVRNWTTTPLYQTQATLQFDMDLNILGVDRPLLPLDQRDWMASFFPTQLAIIESRDVAARAHEDLRLSASGKPAGNEGSVGVSRAVPSVDDIMGGRSAALVKDSRLVTVGFIGPNPQTAAQVANALARAYVQQNADFKLRASARRPIVSRNKSTSSASSLRTARLLSNVIDGNMKLTRSSPTKWVPSSRTSSWRSSRNCRGQ